MRSSSQRASELLGVGHDWEVILTLLRSEGYSIIDSIRAYRDVSLVSLGEAKGFVHCSNAWSDRRAAHEAMHEMAWRVAIEIDEEEHGKDQDNEAHRVQ